MNFGTDILKIDAAAETERIVEMLRISVRQTLKRYGGVVGISGGVDSSVVLALCVRAFGNERVSAIMMPEKDSDPETERFSRLVARHYGVEPVLEEVVEIAGQQFAIVEPGEPLGRELEVVAALAPLHPEQDGAAQGEVRLL